jgi:hypothetical protein
MSILRYRTKLLANGGVAMGGGGKGGGSSGGGGATQQANQYQNISSWASPYLSSILGAAQAQVFNTKQTPGTEGYWTDASGNKVDAATAQAGQGNIFGGGGGQYTYNPGTPVGTEITGINPYTAYGLNGAGMSPEQQAAAEASVAGFTPLQQQAFQGAANLQVPGQYDFASNLAGTAGTGALGTVGQAGMYGGMGAQYGAQNADLSNMFGGLGAQAGQQYAGQSSMYGNQGSNIGNQAAGQSTMYGGQGANIGQQYGGLSAQTGAGAQQAGQQAAGVSNMYGGLGALQGQQGANIGANLANLSTNPNALQAYMNPYIQNAINPALQTLNQQYGIAGQQAAGQATSAGAFGGSRSALANSLNQQNQMLAQNQLVGNAYMQAANEATTQMNTANQAALSGNAQALQGYGMGLQGAGQAGSQALQGYGLGLQGLNQAGQLGLAGTAQGLQGAQQAGQLGLAGNAQALQGTQQAAQQAFQGYGMGLQGAQQAGQLGIAGAQAGLAGVQGQQAGYGLANTAAGSLANIGSQQLAARQGILGLQNQYGTQQQQQRQNIINQGMQNYATSQQYPMSQLQQLRALISGLPMTDTTTTQQQATASPISQLAGLGTTGIAGLGLYNAMNKGQTP